MSRKKKKTPWYKRIVASVIITLAIVGSGSFGYSAYNYEFPAEEYSFFYKPNGKYGCTGTRLSEKIFVSGIHCIDIPGIDLKEVVVDGVTYSAKIVKRDTRTNSMWGKDGFLYIQTDMPIEGYKIAKTSTEITDTIYLRCGHQTFTHKITSYAYFKTSTGHKGFAGFFNSIGGCSGGAYFNEYGEVVGVHLFGAWALKSIYPAYKVGAGVLY